MSRYVHDAHSIPYPPLPCCARPPMGNSKHRTMACLLSSCNVCTRRFISSILLSAKNRMNSSSLIFPSALVSISANTFAMADGSGGCVCGGGGVGRGRGGEGIVLRVFGGTEGEQVRDQGREGGTRVGKVGASTRAATAWRIQETTHRRVGGTKMGVCVRACCMITFYLPPPRSPTP